MTDKTKLPAVFIDRDGTLIEEVNFLSRIEDLKLFDFSAKAVNLLKSAGYLVIVITNQSGIGRGIFEEAAMHDVHSEIQARLNVKIDGFYFCPHLPDEDCACRKPGLGMINNAIDDFEIDLSRSWVIGDKKLDVETGFKAGIHTAMVMTGYGRKQIEQLERRPDIVAENFLEAVTELLGRPTAGRAV
jgi:D-glycero-D-manno-heptose 1,7-bisphosphate phosphatase